MLAGCLQSPYRMLLGECSQNEEESYSGATGCFPNAHRMPQNGSRRYGRNMRGAAFSMEGVNQFVWKTRARIGTTSQPRTVTPRTFSEALGSRTDPKLCAHYARAMRIRCAELGNRFLLSWAGVVELKHLILKRASPAIISRMPMLCAGAALESRSGGRWLPAIILGMPMWCAGASLERLCGERWMPATFLLMPMLCASAALESLSGGKLLPAIIHRTKIRKQ